MRKLYEMIAEALERKEDDPYRAGLIEQLETFLPSGSGFDDDTKIAEESNTKKIVLTFGYHHMNDAGYYTGWTQHKVILTPAFLGVDIRITNCRCQMFKDYCLDTFAQYLSKNIEYDSFDKEIGFTLKEVQNG